MKDSNFFFMQRNIRKSEHKKQHQRTEKIASKNIDKKKIDKVAKFLKRKMGKDFFKISCYEDKQKALK